MALSIMACAILVFVLKGPGIIISCVLFFAAWLMVNARPDASEHKALRASIRLSAEDITDVLKEYETFSTAVDTDSVADRTLHRPALCDRDCNDPDIEAFHYQHSTAQRFLNRLGHKLDHSDMEIAELENLLKVTDQRALDIQEAWLNARRSAFKLGPNYKNPPRELD